MPRELRISVTVQLPDDKWDEAEALVKAKPLLDRMKQDFPDAAIEDEIVTPKPRGKTEVSWVEKTGGVNHTVTVPITD